MNKMSKIAILAAFGLAGITTVKATSYDLLVGFTKQSGSELIYDLGPVSGLNNGKTWNLNSLLSGFTLSSVKWGIIGNANNADGFNPQATWMTTSGTSIIPHKINGGGGFDALDTSISSIEITYFGGNESSTAGSSATPLATDANSWNTQTISGTLPSNFINADGNVNPNVTGLTSDTLWQILDDNSSPTQLGSFTLGSNGVLTYNTASTTTAPTITLNTPANSAAYAGYATIPLSATVVSNSNPIASVQFYSGSTLLATVVTPPYTASWSYVAPGSYPAVTAQANYGASLTVTSAVASVTVNALVAPVTGQPVKNANGYSFGFTGPVGQPYTILTSTNVASSLASWTVAVTNVTFGATGSASFTNTTPSDPQRYYRVKSP